MATPPAQSRDATSSSRFFNTPSSNGRVLVPDSSPLTLETSRSGPSSFVQGRDGGQIPKFNPTGSSRPQGFKLGADPLSRPSGFVASTGVNNAVGARPDGRNLKDNPEDDGLSDNERPRKRANLAQSPTLSIPSARSPGSPTSPEILRAGQKRKFGSNKPLMPSSSVSSEDAFPESSSAIAGPSKPRIVRRERPASETDPQLLKFRMVNPEKPPSHVDAAWRLSGKDIRKATALLMDPDFDPSQSPKPASSSSPPVVKVVGKVKEVEEEREAKRAQERQMAAKSAIYRTQRLDATPPPSSSPGGTRTSKDYDSSPDRPRPIKKIAASRRQIVDSASEGEPEAVLSIDSESDIEIESLDSFEKQALDSFNNLELAALRELAGDSITCSSILNCAHKLHDRLYPCPSR